MKPKRAQKSAARRGWRLALCVAAVVVTLPAGCSLLQFWRAVPKVAVQARFFPRTRQQEAYRRALRSPRAAAAFRLSRASRALTAAMVGQSTPAELEMQIDQALAGPVPSQLGRLQRAAARLWELRRAGVATGQWWPAVRPYLEGIEHADFAHLLEDLTASLAEQYRAAGLGPGTGWVLARWAVANDHGPFLERFVADLAELIADRRDAGDEAAARICRGIRDRLLRQWVLDPGPATLRLLAADLLADCLEHTRPAGPPAREVVAALRAWRSRYRTEIARRPLAVLAAYQKPALAPRESEALTTRAALTVWLAAALVVPALVAIVCAPWLLRRREEHPPARRDAALGIVVGVVIVAAGVVWIAQRPEAVRADLRADFSALRYWPIGPFLAAGLAGLLLAAAVVMRWRAGGRAGRAGAAAAGAWLTLALALWAGAVAADAARRDYERATAAACRDPVAAVLGKSQASELLAPLRAWQP